MGAHSLSLLLWAVELSCGTRVGAAISSGSCVVQRILVVAVAELQRILVVAVAERLFNCGVLVEFLVSPLCGWS